MASLEHWRAERDDDNRLWLTLDKADSGANVLSGPVLRELDSLLDEAYTNPPKALLIRSAKKSGFIMGADINEFTVLEDAQEAYELVRLGQQVLDRLENASFPTVAIIDGFALGGGLELAMACHYRVAVATDKKIIGLPEVKLGIHPGFGGTVRAVRLAGVAEAMPLMLTGKSLAPKKAQRIGLIDRVWAFIAPKIVGGATAPTPFGGGGIGSLADALNLNITAVEQLDGDIWIQGDVCSQE